MILKEFDLDLPYVADEEKIKLIMKENNYSRNEATKYDYETNWKDKRRTFRLETRCISAMFERLLGKIKTSDCWKILVECVEDIKKEKILNFSGVCTVQIRFDYKSFVTSNDYQKKQKTLFVLMEGIRAIAKENGWDLELFEDVYSRICEVDYINEWVWKKSKKSANRKFIAEVLMQHEVKVMDIYIIIKNKSGTEISREKVISELPDEFAYAKHLGELKWLCSNQVALINKKGNKRWLCEL